MSRSVWRSRSDPADKQNVCLILDTESNRRIVETENMEEYVFDLIGIFRIIISIACLSLDRLTRRTFIESKAISIG